MPNARVMEIVIPTKDLAADLSFLHDRLGFRLEQIFPADDPRIAVLSGKGVHLRLIRDPDAAPAVLRLAFEDAEAFPGGERELRAPGGALIQLVDSWPPMEAPPTRHALVVGRTGDGSLWVRGRAGMLYRDLIPGRLGGAIIASHIRIPEAGPVPDMVHFHDVGFQLIYCHRGWVRLVYEDQGPPFVLRAGDCVTQPPRIRHRVLESSGGLEVIEVSTPAEHITTIDHEMELPTASARPRRDFSGQKFCRSEREDARWITGRRPGFEDRETGIHEASGGAASVRVTRPTAQGSGAWTSHTADIFFTFVLSGSMTFEAEGREPRRLEADDALVIPPGLKTNLSEWTDDLALLEVTLPAPVIPDESRALRVRDAQSRTA